MSNYLKIPIATTEVDSEATGSFAGSKLLDNTQTFLTSVQVGSVVWNTTDNTSAIVTAIDSNTQLSISADIMVINDKYKILSVVNTSGYQLVNANSIVLAIATSNVLTTISLPSGDELQINHAPSADGLAIVQEGMLANSNNTRPQQTFSTVEGGLNGLLVESVELA